MLPAIFGLSGHKLTSDERVFFAETDPAGYILFARNCVGKAQLRALTDELRALSGRDDLPILIDQEGGRVVRLAPPIWPDFPAPARFAALYERAPISALEAARLNALAVALTLAEVGVTVGCTPLLDLRHPGAHDVIGARALGTDPRQVASLGRMVLEGLAAGGVVGMVKHMPGHGRAGADSHSELPVVDAGADELEADLAPFRALAAAPMGMTAHVLYRAWDPDRPATLSATIIADIIRGRIGFEGLLVSDDLGMSALSGGLADRARAAVAAGCDLAMHCSGQIAQSREIAAGLPAIGEGARTRLAKAMAATRAPAAEDALDALLAARDALLSAVPQPPEE